MSEPELGVAAVRQPWTLRALLTRRLATDSADHDLAGRVMLPAVVGSRLLVWVAALATLAIFGHNVSEAAYNDPYHFTEPFTQGWANFLFAPAARWDSVWYLEIAHFGYVTKFSSAFFPLYPLLIHLGAAVFGSEVVVGMVISLGSFAVATYVLYLLARLDLGDEGARTLVLLVALFPTALFFSTVYSESLFLMLSVGAIYAARRERWPLASVLGCLAAGTRAGGVLIALPLIVMYFYGPRNAPRRAAAGSWWRPRYRISWSSLWLLLVPLGLGAYLVYLWIAHDDALAPFQVLHFWRREFAGPFGAVIRVATALPHDIHRLITGSPLPVWPGDPISWPSHDLIDLGFLAFAVAGLAWSWRRVPVAYTIYSVAMLAQVLSYPALTEPLASFPRYVLVIFPLFMGWAGKLAGKPVARRTTLVLSAALLVCFSGLWGYWAWIA